MYPSSDNEDKVGTSLAKFVRRWQCILGEPLFYDFTGSSTDRRPEQNELMSMMKTGGIFSHTTENVIKLNQLIYGDDIVRIYAERKLQIM